MIRKTLLLATLLASLAFASQAGAVTAGTTIRCNFDKGTTTCVGVTFSGPTGTTTVCVAGIEYRYPLFDATYFTSLYKGNATDGDLQSDVGETFYTAVKPHAKLISTDIWNQSVHYDFESKVPTGETCELV